MATPSLSLVHLIRRPTASTAGKPPLLLLLHGVGSHEQDLFGLASLLDPRFFVVSARAPITLGPGAYAWFHVQWTADGPVATGTEAEESLAILRRFIVELVETYGLDKERAYLLGFSQGSIMSLALALTTPELVAGLVVNSGRLLLEMLPKLAPREALSGLPILVTHGTEDQVLPIRYGRAIRDELSTLPVAFSYREYPMAHEISAESLAEVTAWLRTRLDGPRRLERSKPSKVEV